MSGYQSALASICRMHTAVQGSLITSLDTSITFARDPQKMDEWTIVSKSKKKGKAAVSSSSAAHVVHKPKGPRPKWKESREAGDSKALLEVQAELLRTKALLEGSNYCQALFQRIEGLATALNGVDRLLALGLGSFAQSANAIAQLALLLLLKDRLDATTGSMVLVDMFDPVMGEVDRALCRELGITVLSENKQGKYGTASSAKVLYYMPHCPYRLYCNVLWDHWASLDRLLIIGNSFRSYSDRRCSLNASDRTDSVRILAAHMQEVLLWPLLSKTQLSADHDKGVPVEAAFCDMSCMQLDMFGPDGKIAAVLSSRPSDEEIKAAADMDAELW